MAKSLFGNVYDVNTSAQAAREKSALSLAALPAGRVQVAGAGMAGGMLGKGAMEGMGYKSPAQQKQEAMDAVFALYPNPTTLDDFIGISNEFRRLGLPDLAEDAIKQGRGLATTAAYTKQVDIQERAAEDRRIAIKNKPLLTKVFENVNKAKEIQDYLKRLSPESDVTNITDMSQASTFLATLFKDKGERGRQNTLMNNFIKMQRDMFINDPSKLYDLNLSETIPKFTESFDSVWGAGTKAPLGTSVVPPAPVIQPVDSVAKDVAILTEQSTMDTSGVIGHRGKNLEKQKVAAILELESYNTVEGVDALIADIDTQISSLAKQTIGYRGRFAKGKIKNLKKRREELEKRKEELQ